jgi:predicted peptidase
MKIVLLMIIAVSFLAACGNHGRTISESEFPSRTVTVGGLDFGYRVYVPRERVSGQKLPVMLYLHGSNRRGKDNEAQLEDLYENIIGNPQNFPFIIVFPQCREETFWAGPMTNQALAALDQTVEEFGGDKDRLYLAGYSMGGFGVWQTAITYPDKFAALVSVAGGVSPLGQVSEEDRALLSPQVAAAASAPDVDRAYAEALSPIPAWLVHGSDDHAVPVEASRNLAKALREAGDKDVNFIELTGVDHGSIVQAFGDPKLFEWLSRQRLSR